MASQIMENMHKGTACEIHISKPVAMIDDVIDICVCGLRAYQKITMYATLTEDRAKLVSYAHFVADSEGKVNMSDHASLGGTYMGVDAMGLIWSMQGALEHKQGARMFKKTVQTPYYVHIGIMDGFQEVKSFEAVKQHRIEERIIARWYLASDIERTPIRHGRIRGTLFYPKNRGKRAGIIDLFGSSGGLLEHRAALLASYGYTALALAYFDYEDLPASIDYDYDYFDEAVEFMLNDSHVDAAQDIAVIGVSKGAEMVMHMAAYNARIKVCIPINGHPMYSFGFCTYKGKALPVHYHNTDNITTTEYGMQFMHCYDNREEISLIPLHRSRAHFLILQSIDDGALPYEFGIEIAERLLDSGNTHCVLKLCPGAGHLLEPPYAPHCRTIYHKMLGGLIDYGGETRLHACAQKQAWSDILTFLSRHFENEYQRVGRIPSSQL